MLFISRIKCLLLIITLIASFQYNYDWRYVRSHESLKLVRKCLFAHVQSLKIIYIILSIVLEHIIQFSLRMIETQ